MNCYPETIITINNGNVGAPLESLRPVAAPKFKNASKAQSKATATLLWALRTRVSCGSLNITQAFQTAHVINIPCFTSCHRQINDWLLKDYCLQSLLCSYSSTCTSIVLMFMLAFDWFRILLTEKLARTHGFIRYMSRLEQISSNLSFQNASNSFSKANWRRQR